MANPFYAGYYPGSPVARRPKKGGGRPRPYVPEYNPSLNAQFISDVERSVTGVPRWLLEQEWEDIKSSFEASYKADTTLSAVDLNAESQEEIQELPGGIGMKVSVNPYDWITEPEKQIKNLTTGAWSKMANLSDFTQRSRRHFWEGLNTRESSPYYLGNSDEDLYVEDNYGNVLSTNQKAPKNFYKPLAENVGEFMVGSMAAPSRNKVMRNVTTASLNNLATELSTKLYEDKYRKNPRFKTALDSSTYQTAEHFLNKVDFANSVKGTISVVENVQKDLDRAFFGGATDKSSPDLGLAALSDKLAQSQALVKKLSSNPKTNSRELRVLGAHIDEIQQIVSPFTTKIVDADGIEKFVIRDRTSGKFLKQEFALNKDKTAKAGKPIMEWTGKYEAATGSYNIKQLPSGALDSNALKRKLNVSVSKMQNSGFGDGSYGKFLNHVLNNDVIHSKSELNTKVLSAQIPGTDKFLISDAGRKVKNISRYVSSTYEWEAVGDLVEDLQEGRIPSKYIYKQFIKPRIETFTPSYYLGRTLNRAHYFGLTINNDVLEGKVNGGVLGSVGNFIVKKSPLSGIYDVHSKFDVVARVNGRDWKARILVKHEKGFDNLLKAERLLNINNGSIADTFRTFSNGLAIDPSLVGADLIKAQQKSRDFLKLLNSTSATGSLGTIATQLGLDKENLKNINNFRTQFIAKYAKALGLTVKNKKYLIIEDTEANRAILAGFFDSIAKREGGNNAADYFSLGVYKAGVLDKYAKFLSRVQSKTITKVAAWVWDPVVRGRELILEKVNSVISNAIVAIFGDATGGLGYAIAWAIKFAVQWVLTKFEKIFKKFWQAARHLDYGAIAEMFEAAYVQTGKWALYAIYIALVPILIVMGMGQTLLTTLPIFDPSLIGQIQPGGGNLGLGFGDASDVTCSKSRKPLTDYKFMDGLKSENSVTSTAYLIMDGMYQGFWCFWNNSPKYNDPGEPDLFNEYLYELNPNPGDLSNCWNCLFWCTYLPIYSGADISKQARADKMEAFYMNGGGYYVSIEEAYVRGNGDTNIRPGDIVFIHSAGRSSAGRVTDSNHVGLVYAVTPDMVITLHSNSGEKAWAYGVDEDGKVMDNQFHIIQGFGGAN